MDINVWIKKAELAIRKIEIGQTFVIKELFDGIEWSNLSKGERIGFGKLFKNEVIEGNLSSIRYIGKDRNNSAKYEKIKA